MAWTVASSHGADVYIFTRGDTKTGSLPYLPIEVVCHTHRTDSSGNGPERERETVKEPSVFLALESPLKKGRGARRVDGARACRRCARLEARPCPLWAGPSRPPDRPSEASASGLRVPTTAQSSRSASSNDSIWNSRWILRVCRRRSRDFGRSSVFWKATRPCSSAFERSIVPKSDAGNETEFLKTSR